MCAVVIRTLTSVHTKYLFC